MYPDFLNKEIIFLFKRIRAKNAKKRLNCAVLQFPAINKSPLYKRQEGYTLLEVIISVMFFAIIAMGLFLPYCNSISLTVDNKNITAANNLARSYLKDIESEWKIQNNFDTGSLIEIDETYTNNGIYIVSVNSEDIATDDEGIVLIRRINITYKDSEENTLSDIYYDYSRPSGI